MGLPTVTLAGCELRSIESYDSVVLKFICNLSTPLQWNEDDAARSYMAICALMDYSNATGRAVSDYWSPANTTYIKVDESDMQLEVLTELNDGDWLCITYDHDDDPDTFGVWIAGWEPQPDPSQLQEQGWRQLDSATLSFYFLVFTVNAAD